MPLELQPKSTTRPDHHQFEVVAEGLGRYVIDLSLPPGHSGSDARFPVILAVDGNLFFDAVASQVHGGMAQAGTMIPPSIVVGVGYPADEGMSGFYARRNFDFHGPWAMTDPLAQILQRIFAALKASEGKPDLEMRAGGYDRFLGFLRDELLPTLATRFPIEIDARHTLIGDSSGGHFALRALYDPRSPFRRYVAISPGFGSAELGIQRAEAEYAASHSDLDVDLFVCCGKIEVDQEPMSALCRFGSGVTWVAEQFAIRQWPSARVEWEIMNNEDHASIAPRAIAAGLRSVHRVRPGVHTAEIQRINVAMREAMGLRQVKE